MQTEASFLLTSALAFANNSTVNTPTYSFKAVIFRAAISTALTFT